VPGGTNATEGLFVLERSLGPGALAPNQILVDTGQPRGALAPSITATELRLVAMLRADRAVDPGSVIAPALPSPAVAEQAHRLDPTGQIVQIRAAGYSDSGTQAAIDLVRRIRNQYIPAAGFPSNARVLLTGAPAFGVDFIAKAYGAFPWLILAVLVISYLLLLRAFRSIVLPLKAVLMNLLSVAATYGVMVMFFQHGWGQTLLGLGLAADRGLDPDLPIRGSVRALDGLRGVPAPPCARSGTTRSTTNTPWPTVWSAPGGSSLRPRSS
jgi:putative drug exporter of the RND superfamily